MSSFRLRKIVDGLPHVAEMTVRVEPFTHDEVAVSDGVFAWRFAAYGPGAASGGPADQQTVAEAIEGVRYVLGMELDRPPFIDASGVVFPVQGCEDESDRVALARIWSAVSA